jgi:hypothetical protein
LELTWLSFEGSLSQGLLIVNKHYFWSF